MEGKVARLQEPRSLLDEPKHLDSQFRSRYAYHAPAAEAPSRLCVGVFRRAAGRMDAAGIWQGCSGEVRRGSQPLWVCIFKRTAKNLPEERCELMQTKRQQSSRSS